MNADPSRLQQVLVNLRRQQREVQLGRRPRARLRRPAGRPGVGRRSRTAAWASPRRSWRGSGIRSTRSRPRCSAATVARAWGSAIVRRLVELHGGVVRAESEGENRAAGSPSRCRWPWRLAPTHSTAPLESAAHRAVPGRPRDPGGRGRAADAGAGARGGRGHAGRCGAHVRRRRAVGARGRRASARADPARSHAAASERLGSGPASAPEPAHGDRAHRGGVGAAHDRRSARRPCTRAATPISPSRSRPTRWRGWWPRRCRATAWRCR